MLARTLPSAVLLAGPGQPLDWDRPAPDLGLLLGLPGLGPVQDAPVRDAPVRDTLAQDSPTFQPRPQTPDPRPPAYSAILRSLLGCLDRVRVYRLYQEIFNEDHTDCLDQLTVEVDFLQRVHNELFDFDLMAMLQLTWQDEVALSAYGIPLTGYRIPWETGYFEDFSPSWQFLALCIYLHQNDDWGNGADVNYYGDVEIPHLDWLVAVADGEPDETLEQQLRPQLERLIRLPAPFDALAHLIAGALNVSSNLFLMLVPDEFRQEYEQLEFYWIPQHIQWLAAEYREALPAIVGIRAFEAWFEAQDEDWANQAIVAALTGEDLTPWLDTRPEVSALEVEPEPEVEP